MSAIDDKYTQLGGASGFLGQPQSPEQDCSDHRGRFRRFQGGSIYWSPQTGPHEVHGTIRDKWAALGSERSPLGYPVSDETTTPEAGGRYCNFQFGFISWTAPMGAHAVYGPIGEKWAALKRESGFLGFPVTDETGTPDGRGRYNYFQGGSIYWSPDTGAHEVHGLIREKWAALGWERGFLGYPLTDETPTPDNLGRFNHFKGGSIYWTPQTNAHEVHGAIKEKWAALGWEKSILGYPITDELGTPGPGRFSRFQNGAIYWTPTSGAQEVTAGRSPTFIISLDKFHIDNTRAANDDTDHVSFAVKIGDQPLGEPFIKHMGDVDNGDHLVGLHAGPITIDNPSTRILFNYQILNSGHEGAAKIEEVLKKGADALSKASVVTGNWWATAAIAVGEWLLSIVFADCDGPVAVDQINVTGAHLINWTTGSGMYSETRSYPGLDSPTGCGSNSRYNVTWSVIRLTSAE